MDKITTTDCWVVKEGVDLNDPTTVLFPMRALEKKTGMILLTVEQFNTIIKEKEDKAFNDGWCAGNQKLII